MELIEQIKSIAKDGADVTEIEQALSKLNPLSGLTTKEEAWNLVKNNPLLLSTYDQKQNERAKTIEENLWNGKFADELKNREDNLRKGLNPQETESDKKLREMSNKLESMEREKSTSELRSQLSEKAEELGYSIAKAQELVVYGEKAMEKLESDASWFNQELDTRISSKMKEKYPSGQAPRNKPPMPADLDSKIMEARAAGNTQLAMRLQLAKRQQT